VITGSEGG